ARALGVLSVCAAHLVEREPLDGSDLVVIPAIHRGSLDLVAADQRYGLPPVVYSRSHCVFLLVALTRTKTRCFGERLFPSHVPSKKRDQRIRLFCPLPERDCPKTFR